MYEEPCFKFSSYFTQFFLIITNLNLKFSIPTYMNGLHECNHIQWINIQ